MKQMRQLQELDNRKKREEADGLRIKTALQVLKANKLGDMHKCRKDQTEQEQNNYCIISFSEYDEIELCKNPEEFCYQCCDHEYGVLKLS